MISAKRLVVASTHKAAMKNPSPSKDSITNRVKFGFIVGVLAACFVYAGLLYMCVARRLIYGFDQAPGFFGLLLFWLAGWLYTCIIVSLSLSFSLFKYSDFCCTCRRNSLCNLDGLWVHTRGKGALSPHWALDAPTQAHSKPDPSIYFYDAVLCAVWRVAVFGNGHGSVCIRSHGVPCPASRHSIQ